MKKILMMMVALLTLTVVMAQGENRERRAPKKMTPAEMTKRMVKDLNLNDKQKTQVQALNEQYKDYLNGPGMGGQRPPKPDSEPGAAPQQERQRPQMTEAQKAQMKQYKAKREEYDKKLKAILTDAQYKTYQKLQKRRGPGGPGGPRDGKRPERSQSE